MKFSILKLVRFAVIFAATPAAQATTWYVNGVNGRDSNNCKSPLAACKTIRHAISLASSGDSIMVAAAKYTENLTIGFNLNVIGSGARTTIIDGGALHTVATISNANAHVTLSKVTIQNGNGLKGAGVSNSGTLTIENAVISRNNAPFGKGEGGGVNNVGTLTIENTVISGNTALRGGGIQTSGTLTINNTTVRDNIVPEVGGGILNFGTLSINRSTISNNRCCGIIRTEGAGIENVNGATLTINNSTISGNGAHFAVVNGFAKMAINNSTISGNGGGIEESNGTAALQNNIVANNENLNCDGTITSNGYNLSSDGTCNFNGPGDMNNTNPMLGPLQNNGGPTQTMALPSGSPAIDAGNPGGCTDGQGNLLKTDQRGMPRPDTEDKTGCDIGAYERQGSLSAAVNNTEMALSAPRIPIEKAAVTSAPTATLLPTNLTFSTQAIGTASAAKTVTLKNSGTASLSLSSVAITGANAGNFAQTYTCANSLAAGASCRISVTFKPKASGTSTAALSVSDNAANSPQKVTLSGIGTTAKLSSTSLNFGSIGLGASLTKTVSLTNLGTTTLTITGVAITGADAGDFAQTHTCESSLAPGRSCTISVRFTPAALGTRTAALGVRDSAVGSPQTVALSGIGVTGGIVTGYCVHTGVVPQLCGITLDTAQCTPGDPAIQPVTFTCGLTGGIYSGDASRSCSVVIDGHLREGGICQIR